MRLPQPPPKKDVEMKLIIFTMATLAYLSTLAFAAGPNSYQCIRPDGTVVCTVNVPPGGDPSVACNHDCVDCNMTCAARQLVIRDGNERIYNPGAPAATPPSQTGRSGVETPEYCKQQYRNCENTCRSNPRNRTQVDIDACTSSCYSAFSGCGKAQ